MNFISLGVSASLTEILSRREINAPTEIQKSVIPFLLNNRENLIFTSPTGTGKTLAYLLPVLQKLNERQGAGGGIEALILAPTHELCSQIKTEIDLLSLNNFRSTLLIGAVPLNRQIDALKKNRPALVVGNPARVLQLLRMKKCSLKQLRFLVLDEGDRLLSEELFPETEALCSEALFLSSAREHPCRFISCSATFTEKSREQLFSLVHSAEALNRRFAGRGRESLFATPPEQDNQNWRVIEEDAEMVLQRNIEHWALFSENRKKIAVLRSFLAATKPKKALVFTARGGEAGNILSQLRYHHFAAGGIWGDLDKKVRKAAMDDFRSGKLSVLVATDLACRGLDIPGLSHVIAMDIPEDPELYLHRSGRTGRIGKRGIMASIGNEEELRRLQRIEKKLRITVYPKELYGGRCTPPSERK
jgi:superfamily II DNA/RNA helicase